MFEHARSRDVRAAPWCPPDSLVLVLIRYVVEKITRHEVVIQERFVTVLVILDELVRQVSIRAPDIGTKQ